MLDPKTLTDRRDEIAHSCKARGIDVDLDAIARVHRDHNLLVTELGDVNRQRNEHQKSGKRKMDPEEREAHTAEGRRFKEQVATIEARLRESESVLTAALRRLPNFLHPESPIGGEEDFREISRSGEIPKFDFEPKNHLQLCEDLDLVDFERAARVAGSKWYYLKNEAALLDIALQRFALDILMEEGFTPVTTPDVARPDIVEGLGFNPRGEETQIYTLENADLCLVGTAEITLGGMYADTIFDEDDLPIKLAGVSHCFRTEAGAAGRESKGLYRVHQFTKTEMFVFTTPEQSEAQHDELLRIEKRVFDALEIPYRVIDIATGDLGAPAYRKFDLEAWMPGRGESGEWGEITSTSNCTDFQARRLKLRFKRKGSKKNEMLHTLNGTAISNARAILSLLEVHQQKDGSVRIPEALQPYMGREQIGPR
ncbi:MAG: serine--tRNA ligase [Myxococcota bacterium]|jgi:seryl-tRNA synthetase|nr:serine--tRNA ligase [Myxococcota bacterium]